MKKGCALITGVSLIFIAIIPLSIALATICDPYFEGKTRKCVVSLKFISSADVKTLAVDCEGYHTYVEVTDGTYQRAKVGMAMWFKLSDKDLGKSGPNGLWAIIGVLLTGLFMGFGINLIQAARSYAV